ncbi:MAG: asparagine synthase (glutamine-hydrolyzing) [Bacteroidetes bacterium RIFCSPLOWO2_02_FULL_36_8]|nr:MAG: asparagine synthase (glutamine-hydrolyzing) [Bacteroidetes bacterium RIFCSPLOWO2_02_FULL_36_8]
MCGICGQYNFKNQSPVILENIKRMTNTLVHRGPDDEGYYLSGPLGFGFRRLSIIDLAGGHQPMSDKGKSVWVVFNGEIYNFPELKKELEGYGHEFQTRSDTEVIIHGYKQWGVEVFNHLNGMFGLAIWDEKDKKLVISRDAMGIKLVYYKVESGSVYFGSELRAVIATLNEKSEVDPSALNLFLRYRYTPSPLTLFKGIKKLAPGTMLIFENGKERVERWYRYKPVPFSNVKNVNEAKEELLELYKKSVKRHLISDVPVGLLLSGGIDSGLLLGLMNLYGKSWHTYTVGYGKSFKDDELSDAAETAKVYSADNISIELKRETFEKTLPKIVKFLEEPIASSSIVPMYFVCERARQDVKVALVGQGPDELFGGYKRHFGVRYGEYWRDLPGFFRTPLTMAINSLPRNESLKRGVYSLNIPDRMKRYQYVFSIMPGEIIDGLFQEGLLDSDAGDKILECWAGLEDFMEHTDELGGFQFLELRSSLPDELLMYADKLSMAHGLEVRVPYLDRELVEYVEKLPANFKVKNGTRKWLHRKVCNDFLPKSIINRKKRGFAVNVVDEWFQNSLSNKLEGMLLDNGSLMYKFLRPEAVHQLVNEHISKKNDNHKVLFSLVVFEEWLRST